MLRLAVVFGLFISGAAQAMSCLPPDVASTFRDLNDRPEVYIIAVGRFSGGVRSGVDKDAGVEQRLYRFRGKGATRTGFTTPLDIEVTVSLSLPDPYIAGSGGHLYTNGRILVFMEERSDGHFMQIGPCDPKQFFDPTRQEETTALNCLRGKACVPQDSY